MTNRHEDVTMTGLPRFQRMNLTNAIRSLEERNWGQAKFYLHLLAGYAETMRRQAAPGNGSPARD